MGLERAHGLMVSTSRGPDTLGLQMKCNEAKTLERSHDLESLLAMNYDEGLHCPQCFWMGHVQGLQDAYCSRRWVAVHSC